MFFTTSVSSFKNVGQQPYPQQDEFLAGYSPGVLKNSAVARVD